MKILFASSEVWPLLKTGGLGDVAYSLPHALQELDADVRLVLPAYQDVLKQIDTFKVVGWFGEKGRVLEVEHPAFDLPIWLVDCQELYDRPGNPYIHESGHDWLDNAERFSQFAKYVAILAMDEIGLGWKADVVHSNDWPTGLVSAFLADKANRPRTIFTIHNLSYGGHFSREEFLASKLPESWWHMGGVEFYGGFSMLKAGLVYSDFVTTVSPTYAKEICTPEFGHGMEGILSGRSDSLFGILNGIDEDVWNPEKDKLIPHHYTVKRRNPGKQKNKQALLEYFDVQVTEEHLTAPLFGSVGRLVGQKGIDLIIEAIPSMIENSNANFVFVGTGDTYFESALTQLNIQYPERVFVFIGYSEPLAHLLEAGSDVFLMPSRFEPCGLNQMYSLRYGTPPLVTHTGGLADTVVNAADDTIANNTATGFVMADVSAVALVDTLYRVIDAYNNKAVWQSILTNGMQQDFSWETSAKQYMDLYQR